MQSVNNSPDGLTSTAVRQQIARLSALTLIFSYAELLIPRVLPFFRLGLGNAALLMGLACGLTFPAFMLLSLVKAVAANLMAGTLFSPFFLVSFAQSLVSALIMFGLFRAGRPGVSRENRSRRLLSLYGISICGAAASALVQIALSSLYLGQGTWSLLGPMLLFNLVSGTVTALLAEFLGNANEGGGSLPLARTSLLATPSSGGRPPPQRPRRHSRLTPCSPPPQYSLSCPDPRRGGLRLLHKKHRSPLWHSRTFFPRPENQRPQNPAPASHLALALRAGNFRAHTKRPRPLHFRRLFNHRGRRSFRLTKGTPPFHRERPESDRCDNQAACCSRFFADPYTRLLQSDAGHLQKYTGLDSYED